MIDESMLMVDIDPRQFRRFYDLVLLPRKQRRIYLLHDQGRVVKAYDTERGVRSDLQTQINDPERRAQEIFESEPGVGEVLVLERNAVRHYFGALQATYTPTESADEYFDRAFRALGRYPGGIVKHPPGFPGLRCLGIDWEVARNFLQRYVPPDSVLVFAAFDDEKIWSSWIIALRGGRIVRVSSSDAIMQLDARVPDWRNRYREVIDSCNKQLGPVSLGLFMERQTLEDVVAAPNKQTFLRQAVKDGRMITDPLPDAVRRII